MLSIFSPHFINWTEQLKHTHHEIYWLDVLDSNTEVNKLDFVNQVVGWRYRWNHPGRYRLKSSFPSFNRIFNKFNERNFKDKLESEIARINPDVVHCFVMFLTAVPAFEVIKKYRNIKWIYTAWGSDLFLHQNIPEYFKGLESTLPMMDYLFVDCKRDERIAKELGFNGECLGVFPGGGGFELPPLSELKSLRDRKLILVKGYQDDLGECIKVLEALKFLSEDIKEYHIIVFGANDVVNDFLISSDLNKFAIKVYGKLPNKELMDLMKEALIYIGNSRSDGMPNTLLEAIVMGAFPIQSDPGGATSEIISNGINGFLIEDPDNVKEIATKINSALADIDFIKEAVNYNNLNIRPGLERDVIRKQVVEKYDLIESQLKN
jgi:glycosyltransferase involved in cell wall biosynthesis